MGIAGCAKHAATIQRYPRAERVDSYKIEFGEIRLVDKVRQQTNFV